MQIDFASLLDIVDGGSPEDRRALAEMLAPNFIPGYQQRAAGMEDTRQNFWPRLTIDDADIVNNSAGAAVWGGQSRFAVVDFPGATGWIDTNDGNTAHIRTAGGGADCMFDYLVSSCYAALVAAGTNTEGQAFTSLTGCTFYVFSTVQGAFTKYGTEASGSDKTMFICGGRYNEAVVMSTAPTSGTLRVLGAGSGDTDGTEGATIIGPTLGDAFTVSVACAVEWSDITFDGGTTNNIALTNSNTSAFMKFTNCLIDGDIKGSIVRWQWDGCTFNHGSFNPDGGVCTDPRFNDCKFKTAMTSSGGTPWGGVVFDNCHFAAILNIGNVHVRGLKFDGCTFGIDNAGGQTDPWITFNQSGQQSRIRVIGCTFANPTTSVNGCIYIQAAGAGYQYGNEIIGNTFAYMTIPYINSGSANVEDWCILGNAFAKNTGTPGYLEDLTANASVMGTFKNSTFGPNAPGSIVQYDIVGTGNVFFPGSAESVPGTAGSGSATNTEPFVTIGNTAGLSAERALAVTPADGEHTFTDGGANADVTLVGVDATATQKGHAILGQPMGLTGAVAATRYVGATASGAPVAGTFAIGDFVVDQSGAIYVCTVAGTPGTWVAVGAGGSAHDILSATHSDSVAQAVSRGSLVYGNSTPKWDELVVGTGHLGGDGTDVAYVKDAFAQIAAPAVTDDSGDGYVVGSRWYDTTNDKEYVALDVSVGAAVWKETTIPAGGGSAHTIRENGTDQTARTGLNFIDADAGVGLITDDAVNNETEVNLGLYVLEAAVPGGELGGTYASPTVDATHSGSTHTDFIAKALVDAAGDLLYGSAADTVARLAIGTAAYKLHVASGLPAWTKDYVPLLFIIDGGGATITTGQKGHIYLLENLTCEGWTILADQSGSIVVDVWMDTYANFPPTVADTIAGTEKPTLSTAQKNQDLSLSSFDTTLDAGSALAFNVDSVTTVQRVSILLHCFRR